MIARMKSLGNTIDAILEGLMLWIVRFMGRGGGGERKGFDGST